MIPALFDSLTAIIVALIGTGVLSVRRSVKRVQAQVENDHTTNMRDEADSRHAENAARLSWIGQTVTSMQHDIGGIRQDIRDLRIDQRRERERIDELEDTINPHQKE